MVIHAYLPTSLNKKGAKRAHTRLLEFAKERNWTIASTGTESEGGASSRCPGLFLLLSDCKPGDILLIAQIDRLARLNTDNWNQLRAEMTTRDVLIVSPDIPTSWTSGSPEANEPRSRIDQAITATMIDVLSTIARKAQEEKRWLQHQGIAAAKAAGSYRGRPENTGRNDEIIAMLRRGESWLSVRNKVQCSNSTIARMSKRIKNKLADE